MNKYLIPIFVFLSVINSISILYLFKNLPMQHEAGNEQAKNVKGPEINTLDPSAPLNTDKQAAGRERERIKFTEELEKSRNSGQDKKKKSSVPGVYE